MLVNMSTTVHIVDMLTQVGQCENTRGETLLPSPNKGTEEHCGKVSSQIPQGRHYFEKTIANLSFLQHFSSPIVCYVQFSNKLGVVVRAH